VCNLSIYLHTYINKNGCGCQKGVAQYVPHLASNFQVTTHQEHELHRKKYYQPFLSGSPSCAFETLGCVQQLAEEAVDASFSRYPVTD
jgi:hypothetical protein